MRLIRRCAPSALGVLRHELRDRGTRFSLCQFRSEHELNPDTLARYETHRLRVMPELVYSPWAVSPSTPPLIVLFAGIAIGLRIASGRVQG